MGIAKTAVITAGIAALGIGAYAIASPIGIPVGAAMIAVGAVSWFMNSRQSA